MKKTKRIIVVLCVFFLNQSNYCAQHIHSSSIPASGKPDTTYVNGLNRFARELILKSEFLSADSVLRLALKSGEDLNFKRGVFNSVTNFGVIYYYQDNFPVALQYYLKALKIAEETNSKSLISRAMANVGLIFFSNGEHAKALEYYFKALHLKEELKDEAGITAILSNIGNCYKEQKEYGNALDHYKQSLAKARANKNPGMIGLSLIEIGTIYELQSDTMKALASYVEALKASEECGDKVLIPSGKGKIAAIYIQQSKYKQAEELLISALKISEEIGDLSNQSELNQKLSELYVRQKNWQLSYKYYKNYTLLKDTIFNAKKTKELVRNEMNFEFDKKQTVQKIEQEKRDAIVAEEMKQQKTQRNYLIIGLMLMLIVAILVFRSYRQKQKANKIIALQKKEVEKQKEIVDKQKHILEEKHKEITDSINYAERIQRSFLATKELLDNNLNDYFVFFQPKDVVSGDFYWAGKLNNGDFALATADSTGHGVPGAIMSILNISCLEKSVEEEKLIEPDQILNHSRKKIIERLKKDGSPDGGKDGMDCSIICFDFKNNKLSYAAANNPIWIVRGNQILELPPDKMPVGKHDKDTVPFTKHNVELQKNDVVYALTDGMPDQFGGQRGKKFMYKQLKELLISISLLQMNEQKEALKTALDNWKGDLEQVDDVCIIGVKV
ncbi:MAG: protein serine/threonine phosphatase [Bacteroidetes bacterium]|nr:protein serine/threonine phosphatase [Bacteroidota bacterium]